VRTSACVRACVCLGPILAVASQDFLILRKRLVQIGAGI